MAPSHITRALDWTPAWMVQRIEEAIEQRSARLVVHGDSDPDVVAGLDGDRVGRARQTPLFAAIKLRPRTPT